MNNQQPWYMWNECSETFAQYKERLRKSIPFLTDSELEVLRQCRMTIWDGNVNSKAARDRLNGLGLITRWEGWQVITQEGMVVLSERGDMKDDRWPYFVKCKRLLRELFEILPSYTTQFSHPHFRKLTREIENYLEKGK